MTELTQVISKMKRLKIEANYEQYMELIDTCGYSEQKHLVFRIISSAPGSTSIKLSLIYSLVSKLKDKYDNKLVQDVLEYVTKCTPVKEDFEWIAKIVFMIIENIRDKRKNDEIKLLVMENLHRCSQEINILGYLFNFMLSDNSWEIVYALLVFMPEICDSFVRSAIQQTNVNILKNVGHVLSTLSGEHKSLFVNYKHFDSFLDSEHHFLRNCYLDIVTNLVDFFKDLENIQEIENIIGILQERLNDVYFNVRYKALNLLGTLFQNNSVPKNIRNSVIKEIGERVLDKTIIVRKRAVAICSFILMNHPFKSETSLKKKEGATESYFEDLNEFHDVMKEVLSKVTTFLGTKSTGDLYVFIEFIKLCLYYEIEGSKEAFELVFDFIFENEEEAIATCFSDIVVRLKMRKKEPYDFLKQFVGGRSPSFERIIRELWKRKVIDNELHQSIVERFLKGVDLYECSYFLRFIPKYLEEEKYLEILRYSSEILFSVQDAQQLVEAFSIYNNILRVQVSKKVEGKIPSLIIKNLSKMVFFDYQTVQSTVQALYSLSRDPEEGVCALFQLLSLKNVNSLKLIYTVGCVGLIHLEYLEKLERIAKKKKTKMESIVPEDIRERRKSINASRMSLQSGVIEEIDRPHSGSELDLEGFIKSKTEEELSDFFFFIKEKDLLYNKESLLYFYAKDIPKMCRREEGSVIAGREGSVTGESVTHSQRLNDIKDIKSLDSDHIQEVAYLSLFKLMCVSSEYFQEHKSLLRDAFTHKNPKIRSNAIVAMGDFLLYYNSMVEDLSPLLFESLNDLNLTVKKNGILTIFNLLIRNILRVSGSSTHLSRLVFDGDEEVRNIAKTIISTLSDNENFITVVFYERLTTEKVGFKEFVDLFLPFLKERTKEMVYMKLLRASLDEEVLNYVFTKFNFNEKFTEDLKMIK